MNDNDPEKAEASEKELGNYLRRVNESYIPESISRNFLIDYFEDERCSALFTLSDELKTDTEKLPPATFDDDSFVMTVDLYALLRYAEEILNANRELDAMREGGISNFKISRQLSFMREMAKIPTSYLFYLSVLQEVAYKKEIVSVEDKEGLLHESDSGFYLTLLWGLKEFESFYLKTQNRNLRADYGLIWHEGEWVEDDTQGRGYS
ncbi:MAG: hypothetical protein KAG97_06400 [Victivallales bacterium]|nr:hypothetical protein [Victivallales bacterium]